MSEAVREMTFREEYEILQKEKNELFALEDENTETPFANCVVRRALRCIKKLREEYNGGWIPCSKRLPEKNGKYLVCIDNPTRNEKDCIFTFWFNAYYNEFEREHDLDYVIAWRPLPEPYKECER